MAKQRTHRIDGNLAYDPAELVRPLTDAEAIHLALSGTPTDLRALRRLAGRPCALRAADALDSLASATWAAWTTVRDAAHLATFGVLPLGRVYQVAGIGRAEYNEAAKDALRTLAVSAGEMRAAAAVLRTLRYRKPPTIKDSGR